MGRFPEHNDPKISNCTMHLTHMQFKRKSFSNTFFFLFRYATILYYLNDIDDGGETAFPVVDNATFDKQV